MVSHLGAAQTSWSSGVTSQYQLHPLTPSQSDQFIQSKKNI